MDKVEISNVKEPDQLFVSPFIHPLHLCSINVNEPTTEIQLNAKKLNISKASVIVGETT
jgi:hypothetical protein